MSETNDRRTRDTTSKETIKQLKPEDELKNIKANLNKIFIKLDQFSATIKKINSMEDSLNFISNKVDEFNMNMESIMSKFKIQEKMLILKQTVPP